MRVYVRMEDMMAVVDELGPLATNINPVGKYWATMLVQEIPTVAPCYLEIPA